MTYICDNGSSYVSFVFGEDNFMMFDEIPAKYYHEKGDYYSIKGLDESFIGYIIANEQGIAAVRAVGELKPVFNCIVA